MSKMTAILHSLKFAVTRNPRQLATLHAQRGVRMGRGCQIYGGVGFGSEPYLVSLGDDVKITARTQFITHDGGMHVLRQFEAFRQADVFGRIQVGNRVFIGIGSIVLPGVSIGDNVVIGAGSIVTRDIPANSVAAGVPCRVIRTLAEYQESARLKVDMTKGLDATAKRRYLEHKYGLKRAATEPRTQRVSSREG